MDERDSSKKGELFIVDNSDVAWKVQKYLSEWSPELNNLITEFKGGGDNVVGAIGKNSYKDGKLKINKTQYFEGYLKRSIIFI